MWEVGVFFKIWFNYFYVINVIVIFYLVVFIFDDLMFDNVFLNILLVVFIVCKKRNNY